MAGRSSREEEKDSSRARETKPTGPEDEGLERPIWKDPRPTARASVPDTDYKEGPEEGDPAAVVLPEFQ